ncbi:WD40/YVTN/BNR-like repeat-containing protein [Actinomadura sp. 3N508]|uniref:WD40/YVTN/BNR-like repeat-containing protein n=1 Tax=Actinomadura sp. 3N508 TaxID=3375153 RepID=UPI0037A3C3D2
MPRSPLRPRHATRVLALIMILAPATVLAAVPADADTATPAAPPRPRGPMAPGEFKARQDTSGDLGLPERALVRASEAAAKGPRLPVEWRSEGPANIGGRVTGIAVDPNRRDTVYIGAASGGVWKSTDRGTTLTSVWPRRNPQAIGAMAAGSDGAIYAGTGEANPGGGSITYEGDGVYKSTDGGRSWTRLGLRNSATISLIAVDPENPRRIFVAATGSLFRPGGERGVYRSEDGGRTWTLVLAGANDTTGANSVVIDPGNPRRVWASMWDRRRKPDLRRYGGVGSGLFRSDDGGSTWRRLENIVTPTPGDDIGLRSDPRLGRIGLGVAPGDPDRVYVLTSTFSQFGDVKGFYVSDDGGGSFRTGTLPASDVPFWWTGHLWVDPADRDHLYMPSASLRESADAGRTWKVNQGMHVDHHAMVWDAKVPGRVYEGNDGGLYRSDANGATQTWIKAASEPYTQFYSVTASAQDVTRMAGGTQDNGSVRTWNGPRWNEFLGGDGEANVIHPQNHDILYSCYQFGACFRSDDAGDTLTELRGAAADRFNWFSPIELHPADPSVVYFGGDRLNRSANGLDFTPISPDLTGGPGRDEVYPFGTLTTVAAAKTAPGTVVVGSDDGRISLTRDDGAHWSQALKDQPWVTRVEIDPQNARRMFATLSGYRANGTGGHVLYSDDGGDTWRDISGNLPGAPANDIVIGPHGLLLIATDVGVYAGPPSGGFWFRLGDLPLAAITDIEFQASSSRLIAATFGRGIYSTRVPRGLAGKVQAAGRQTP